jgi:hypothetical protein
MKCLQLLLWAWGAVSFAYAGGDEFQDLDVEEWLRAVNGVEASTTDIQATDIQTTVDYKKCDNFGLHRCGVSGNLTPPQ